MPNGGIEPENQASRTAPTDSPYPWHVRLGSYRFGLPPSQTIPQWLADRWTEVMQEAVEAWAKGDSIQPDLDCIDNLSDEQVSKRIQGYQTGYNKEWTRREVTDSWYDYAGVPQGRYIFADMPLELQRAIVSRWDAVHNQWIAEHTEAAYTPELGYYWRITVDGVTVTIKNWEYSDKDKPPTQADSEKWEVMGFPGGILGYWYPASSTGPDEDTMYMYVDNVPTPNLSVEGADAGRGGD